MTLPDTDAWKASLQQRQRKLTRPRQTILDVIAEAGQCLTPAEVYLRAKARYPALGLTTVYRTLDLLVDLGYIQRVHGVERCHSYGATRRTHGHHLVCSGCGSTVEFSDCGLDALVAALQARTGFRVDHHILELCGLCPACQRLGRPGCALKGDLHE